MSARTGGALLLAVLLLGGCGEKPEPDVSKPSAVTGTVDLARPESAPPDGGTRFGHRMADATATTRRSRLAFGGSVKPPQSQVTLARVGRAPEAVRVGAGGRFRALARGLSKGANRYVLKATAPGLRPWTVDVSIVRK